MIRSYRCNETRRIFDGGRSGAFPPEIHGRARRKLQELDAARALTDLASPGNHLEVLKGDRAGEWSIRINRQWRICFRWENGADDVEIVDYH